MSIYIYIYVQTHEQYSSIGYDSKLANAADSVNH